MDRPRRNWRTELVVALPATVAGVAYTGGGTQRVGGVNSG